MQVGLSPTRHDAIARAHLADRLDDVAGQRADVGAPMAANFRLVVDAAETDAHEPHDRRIFPRSLR